MKKPTTTTGQKGRNATATKAITKNRNGIYANGKKMADRLWRILSYQYKESDLQFIL